MMSAWHKLFGRNERLTYLHRGKGDISHTGRGLIEEISDADPAVFRLPYRVRDDPLDGIHLSDDYRSAYS